MLPDWLTPASATALGAGFAALGAILGILIRGAFDARFLARQIQMQYDLAERQIESRRAEFDQQVAEQRRAAKVAALEARAQHVIEERRDLYASFLTQAVLVRNNLYSLAKAHEAVKALGPIDWTGIPRETTQRSFLGDITYEHPAWTARNAHEAAEKRQQELRGPLEDLVSEMALVAPSGPLQAALAIKGTWTGRSSQDATAAIEELGAAIEDFRQQARIDLGTDPPPAVGDE